MSTENSKGAITQATSAGRPDQADPEAPAELSDEQLSRVSGGLTPLKKQLASKGSDVRDSHDKYG